MDVAWRFRIMIFAVLALMLFGDFFVGFGSVRGVKSDSNQATSTAGKFQQKNAEIEIGEGESDFLLILIKIFNTYLVELL